MTTTRSIQDCLSGSSTDLTDEEVLMVSDWLDTTARNELASHEYCCLLGWFLLDNRHLPLSPKEAGFD